MGQVEHHLFAKKDVLQTHESFEDHIDRSRTKCGIPESPLRLRPRWVARAAVGDLSTRFAWPRSSILDQDSDGRVDFPAWWLHFI